MFSSSTISHVLFIGLAALATGCHSGEQPQPEPATSETKSQVGAKSTRIADAVDQMLKRQNLIPSSTQEVGTVSAGFGTLKLACSVAGGSFDTGEQECLCPDGGLFTTGNSSVSCAEVSYDYLAIGIRHPSGVYNPHGIGMDSSFGMMLDPYLLAELENRTFVFDAMKVFRKNQESGDAKPFRLSTFERADFLYEIDTDRSARAQGDVFSFNSGYASPYGTFGLLYSTVLGAPFEIETAVQSNENIALYEPTAKYVPAALGQGIEPLTSEDQVRFKSLKLHDSSTDANALLSAYENFRKLPSLAPTSVSTSYASGCASYCVTSEPIPLDREFGIYSASFKKVYQMGAPSARVIVLSHAQKGVVGIHTLNVANTVSTVNLVTDETSGGGALPEVGIQTYDRYGVFLYQQRMRALPGVSFPDPLQYVKN
jgi:hypothetical protein